MGPYRSSRTGNQRRVASQPDHDVFEGLPIRHWRKKSINVNTTYEKPDPNAANALPSGYNELPMPKDANLLSEASYSLLRAARMGLVRRDVGDGGDDGRNGRDGNGIMDDETGLLTRKWAPVPRESEGPEPEFLAKRRKGLPSLYGVPIPPQGMSTRMRKTKIRKVDAKGKPMVWDILLPEGQTIDGEIIVEEESSPVEASVPGTIIDGLGLANIEEPIIPGDQGGFLPPRRKPPPPKRKSKGKSARERKRVAFAGPGDTPINAEANAIATVPTGDEPHAGDNTDGSVLDAMPVDDDGSDDGSEPGEDELGHINGRHEGVHINAKEGDVQIGSSAHQELRNRHEQTMPSNAGSSQYASLPQPSPPTINVTLESENANSLTDLVQKSSETAQTQVAGLDGAAESEPSPALVLEPISEPMQDIQAVSNEIDTQAQGTTKDESRDTSNTPTETTEPHLGKDTPDQDLSQIPVHGIESTDESLYVEDKVHDADAPRSLGNTTQTAAAPKLKHDNSPPISFLANEPRAPDRSTHHDSELDAQSFSNVVANNVDLSGTIENQDQPMHDQHAVDTLTMSNHSDLKTPTPPAPNSSFTIRPDHERDSLSLTSPQPRPTAVQYHERQDLTPHAPTPSPPTPVATSLEHKRQTLLDSPKAPTMSPPTPASDRSGSPTASSGQIPLPPPPHLSLDNSNSDFGISKPMVSASNSLHSSQPLPPMSSLPNVESTGNLPTVPSAPHPGSYPVPISSSYVDSTAIPNARSESITKVDVEAAPHVANPHYDAEIPHEHNPLDGLAEPSTQATSDDGKISPSISAANEAPTGQPRPATPAGPQESRTHEESENNVLGTFEKSLATDANQAGDGDSDAGTEHDQRR